MLTVSNNEQRKVQVEKFNATLGVDTDSDQADGNDLVAWLALESSLGRQYYGLAWLARKPRQCWEDEY